MIYYGTPCQSQNLIPNPGFEDYIGCPSLFYSIDSLQNWFNPSPWTLGGGSPDYFNACDTVNGVGVPNNFLGYQNAHNGNAYCGLYLNSLTPNSTWREYIEVQLISPLDSNTCYEFSLYANLSNNAMYTTNVISVLFSDSLISTVNNNYVLPFTPQINLTGAACDSLNWTKYSANYTANGGEQFIVLGNFNTNANSIAYLVNNSAIFNGVYFHIDDVSLIPIPPCNTGENDLATLNDFQFLYNPLDDAIVVESRKFEKYRFSIFDVMAREVMSFEFLGRLELNTSDLAKGIYVYQIGNSEVTIKAGKFLKF